MAQQADISWEGDSREVIKSWPKAVKEDFGHSLSEMQDGRKVTLDVRPMKSVGRGVFELKDSDDKTWYRLIYVARIDNIIYVLHCFTKDSRKTEQHDLQKAKNRLTRVLNRKLREKRDEKTQSKKSRTTPHERKRV